MIGEYERAFYGNQYALMAPLFVATQDGAPVYRVRVWDAVLKKQIERTVEGLEAAKHLLEELTEAKRRPGRLTAERVRFADVAARYLVAYKTKRDGTPRPSDPMGRGLRWLSRVRQAAAGSRAAARS